MQNKPNLLNAEMNINSYNKTAYEIFIPLEGQKNKPNSSGLRCLLRSCRTDQTQSQYLTYSQRAKIKHAVATAEDAKLLPWLDGVLCLRVSGSLTTKKAHSNFLLTYRLESV